MTIIYDKFGIQVHQGDCLKVIRTLPDASVSAVITDPPAGIGFMSRDWDGNRGGRTRWVEWLTERMEEAHRVLKPGGHALVWALPRTSHWTAWALEDAGFDIRDCIVHLYGSGFPKSLDVSKAIDKRGFGDGEIAAFKLALANAVLSSGKTRQRINDECGFTMRFDIAYDKDPVGWGCSLPNGHQYSIICRVLGMNELPNWHATRFKRLYEVVGYEQRFNEPSGIVNVGEEPRVLVNREITRPGTNAAKQWSGWGTSLKPSSEHWWLCRKPLTGTVAATVLEHGTGALNIDACRIQAGQDYRDKCASVVGLGSNQNGSAYGEWSGVREDSANAGGRWPPNTVLSHVALLDPVTGEPIGDACVDGCVDGCPVAELDRQSAGTRSAKPSASGTATAGASIWGIGGERNGATYTDFGGASRFFPCFKWEAKAPTTERPMVNGKAWPTVKPVSLMRWLARLVTPPGGVILDCFAGTGTTGQAARAEGFPAILIEEDPDAISMIRARLDAKPKTEAATAARPLEDAPQDLFDLLGDAS